MGALQTEIGREAAAGKRVESLHERYAPAVRRYCLRRLRSPEEAEDAAQVAFLTAYRCLLEGVQPRSEGAWLFKIAENVVLQRRRSMARRARLEYAVDVDRIADAVATPPPEGASELDGVGEVLAAMPESQRQAIVLREWYGLSYREVADELGVSSTAVEALIFRARRGLVRRLEVRNRLAQNGRRFGLWLPAEPLKLLLGGGGVGAKVVLGAASIAVVATTARPVVPKLALTAATTRVAPPHAVSGAASRPRHAHHRRPAHAPAAAATPRGGSSVATSGAPAAPPVPDAAPRARAPVAPAAPAPAPVPAPGPAADASSAQATVPTAGPSVAPDGGSSTSVSDTAPGADAGPAPDGAPPDTTTSPAPPTVNPAGKTPPAVGRTPGATPPGLDRAGAQSDPPGRTGDPPPGQAVGNGNENGDAYGNGQGNGNAYGRQVAARTPSTPPASSADPDTAVDSPPADPEPAQPGDADGDDGRAS